MDEEVEIEIQDQRRKKGIFRGQRARKLSILYIHTSRLIHGLREAADLGAIERYCEFKWSRLLTAALALIAMFVAATSVTNQEIVLAKIVVSDLDGFASQYGAIVRVVQIDLNGRTVTALNVTIGDVELYGKLDGGIATLYYRGPACWLLEIADSPYVVFIYVKAIPVLRQPILKFNETSTESSVCFLSHDKIYVVEKVDDLIPSSDYVVLSNDGTTTLPIRSSIDSGLLSNGNATILPIRSSIDLGQTLRIALLSIIALSIIVLLAIRRRKRV